MARIKDTSVAEVKAAADIVEVVGARTSLRRASSSRFTGRCPFHEERTPSFSVDPVDKLYYCFGCGKGGDVVRFVQETENLDFAAAIEWLADRFACPARVRGVLAAGRCRAPAPRAPHRIAGAGDDVLRARPLGQRGRLPRARLSRRPRPGRGDLAGVPPRALPRLGARREGTRERLHDRRDPRRGASEPAWERLLPVPPHVPARGRAGPHHRFPGAPAAGRRPAPGQVRQHSRERAVQEGQRPVRPPSRAPGDCEAGSRDRRGGQHRRDRAAPGAGGAGRRVDGYRAHRERSCASSDG